jgi:hypothetical protein
MSAYLWLNVPIAMLIFLAMSLIPLWMVVKHPDTGEEIHETVKRVKTAPLHAVSRHEVARWREAGAPTRAPAPAPA